ncbi:MAG: hypothetical protein NVSMB47_22320 [Polyangiales bacterium]
MSLIFAALLGAGASAPPVDPSVRGLLDEATFLLPGVHYVDWVPTHPERPSGSGGGAEVSYARHLVNGAWVVGALGQVERVGRWRVAAGVEGGYEFFGLELCAAREIASTDSHAQWSLQLAPYVSAGLLTISARWVIGITARSDPNAPGDGAMLVFGFKLPIALGGGLTDYVR